MLAKRIGGLILAISLATNSTIGQQVVNLEDAIGAALQNNYDILLVRNDSASAALDKSYIYGAFLPTLNGTATRLWNANNQKQKLADGSEREANNVKSNNLAASLLLNWTLFNGFKMFATKQKWNKWPSWENCLSRTRWLIP